MTDMDDITCSCLPTIADHAIVKTQIKFSMVETNTTTRSAWAYRKADWQFLRESFDSQNWSFTETDDRDEAVEHFVRITLHHAHASIPYEDINIRKCNHPWITPKALNAIKAKRDSAGTARENAATIACSNIFASEYNQYVSETKTKLVSMPSKSKAWWSESQNLMKKKQNTSGIPVLKQADGSWCFEAKSKADHFAETFMNKYELPDIIHNEYTVTEHDGQHMEHILPTVEVRSVLDALLHLRPDSAIGLDYQHASFENVPVNLPNRYMRWSAESYSNAIGLRCGCNTGWFRFTTAKTNILGEQP